MAPPGRAKTRVFWKISRNRAHVTEVRTVRSLSAQEKPLLRRFIFSLRGPRFIHTRARVPALPVTVENTIDSTPTNPAGRTAGQRPLLCGGASPVAGIIRRFSLSTLAAAGRRGSPDGHGSVVCQSEVLVGRKIRPEAGFDETRGGDSWKLHTTLYEIHVHP